MEDWALVSRMRGQNFDTIFTYLNVSVYIALFILKIKLRVPFSWRDLKSLRLLDEKVDPGDFYIQVQRMKIRSSGR